MFLFKQFSSKGGYISGKPGLGQINDRWGLGHLEFGVPLGRARGEVEDVIEYTGKTLGA